MRCSLEGDRQVTSSVFSVVGVSFRRRGDDVLYFCGVPVVQLRDHVAELGQLATDAGQGELRLRLDEPHYWSLGPKRRKPHGYSLIFPLVVSCL
jgi:hypothetical protein